MRVARLHGIRDVRIGEEPVPLVAPGDSLVRVTAVGLCGSDLHWFGEGAIGDAYLAQPLVLGHEFAGIVESGPLAGRRVAVDPAIPCLDCPQCHEGNHNLCVRIRFAGHGRQDGGLREFLSWPDRALHPLPDRISDAGGAMLEPLGVALHTFDLGHARIAGSAAVLGCGPIGLLLVQVARAAGISPVIAVDPLPHRRAAAQAFGADAVLTPDEAHAVDPGDLGVAGGVDAAFEAAGTDDAVRAALELARPGARVVLAGIPDDDRTSFPASLARRKGATLVLVRRMKDVYPRAIRLVERGLVDVESVVTQRFLLDQAPQAFATATTRQGLKTLITP
ncbi:MAG: L-iditol 2-dehydrogenase [Micromonosporaceae bacterium]